MPQKIMPRKLLEDIVEPAVRAKQGHVLALVQSHPLFGGPRAAAAEAFVGRLMHFLQLRVQVAIDAMVDQLGGRLEEIAREVDRYREVLALHAASAGAVADPTYEEAVAKIGDKLEEAYRTLDRAVHAYADELIRLLLSLGSHDGAGEAETGNSR